MAICIFMCHFRIIKSGKSLIGREDRLIDNKSVSRWFMDFSLANMVWCFRNGNTGSLKWYKSIFNPKASLVKGTLNVLESTALCFILMMQVSLHLMIFVRCWERHVTISRGSWQFPTNPRDAWPLSRCCHARECPAESSVWLLNRVLLQVKLRLEEEEEEEEGTLEEESRLFSPTFVQDFTELQLV